MAGDPYSLRKFAPQHGPLESVGRIKLPRLPNPPEKLVKIDPSLTAYHDATNKVIARMEEEFNNLVQKLKQSAQPPVT